MNAQPAYGRLTSDLIYQIEKIVGTRNLIPNEGRENYSHDESPHAAFHLPEIVVKPETPGAIAGIMKLANQYKIPVTPRGAGTGLSGGAVPVCGGISLSLEKLNKILEIDEANSCVTAEAGVVLSDLCAAVGERGLYYPLYPGEMSASIGGNVATNAGGMRAVKYGVTRHFVLGVEAVLPTGEIINTGGKYIKSATGYDLTQLLIGSEGTLAIITKAILKLITPPGNREILLVPFNSLSEAVRCVPVILKEKILPVSIEFMEKDIIRLVKDYTGKEFPIAEYPAYLLLMIECDNQEEFYQNTERLESICRNQGAVDVFVPNSESAKRRLLEIREKFYPTMQHRGMLDIADAVVPRSRIAEFVEKVKDLGSRYGISVIAYGHAGDGNVHLHPLSRGDERDNRVKELMSEIFAAAASMGGNISGEHGLGMEKKDYFQSIEDHAKLELMRRVKAAFDPNHILNPGKVLD